MTTNTNPASDPATLPELLLDYFTAATDDQTDDALDALFAYLDASPPNDADMQLMLRACAADDQLNLAIRDYANRD